ncbi:MAG: ATP-binding cassette domain-containing protein, partial [Deltaproteobacteria bacterium]|nr:ATP-binding cassette domain-containing protein [Deltaproteobacteria bacterium]
MSSGMRDAAPPRARLARTAVAAGDGPPPDGPGGVLLEGRNLGKVFKAGGEELAILRGLDLSIGPGHSVAILGASGSGKSTLMYLLGGLDRPSSGSVVSGGRDVFSLPEPELARWRAREVGFVFQFHYLLSDFTALETVAMPALLEGRGRKDALALAEPLLERVGLRDRR